MKTSTTEILLPFEGEGAGISELTWGQQGIWDTIQRTGRTMNIGGAMVMPPGTSVEEIAGLLRYIVERHEALRTRLRWATAEEQEGRDPELRGYPLQAVASSGEIALRILDLAADSAAADSAAGEVDDEVATAEAEALRERLELTPFDHVEEWPVRMAVVRQAGTVTHLVVQYSHLVVDGGGIEAVVRDLAQRDPETGRAAGPVRGVSPAALARIQGSAAGRRQSDKSLRYWSKVLRSIPAQRFNGSDDPREPRYWEVYCYSPAMHLALRAIAARTGADTSHVFLAAYAVALARVTGRSPSVAQVVASNRFRPDFGEAVNQLSQVGICAIDVAGCTFDDVVGRAWKASTDAYLHGYYSSVGYQKALREAAEERGEPIDISCYVNDRRSQGGPQADGPLPTPEELRLALKRTALRWDRTMPTYDGSFYLHADSVPDANVPGRTHPDEQQPPAVYISMWGDTHRMAPDDILECARLLEAVTVEAAFDGDAPTLVP